MKIFRHFTTKSLISKLAVEYNFFFLNTEEVFDNVSPGPLLEYAKCYLQALVQYGKAFLCLCVSKSVAWAPQQWPCCPGHWLEQQNAPKLVGSLVLIWFSIAQNTGAGSPSTLQLTNLNRDDGFPPS
jgi:hypothetical protein